MAGVESASLRAEAEFERLRVVLVRTRNPLNMGTAARAMSNFGFSRLRLVNPYKEGFREARSAVGAAPYVVYTLLNRFATGLAIPIP